MPEQTVDKGDVGAGPQAPEDVGMSGRAGIARIDDDHLGAVFLGAQDVLHCHRMSFGGIGADKQHGLAVVHVVVGVGHGAIAPGGGHPGDGGGMADTGLMIHVVGSPESGEFALQVGALVARFGRTAPEDRIGAGSVADLEQLVADFIDGLFPGKALPGAVYQFHRIFQSAMPHAVMPDRCTFCAVGTEIDR